MHGGVFQQVRRLQIESLERRDCPAVQAFFTGGVLSVVGDEQNNVIDLFQPRDHVVEVVGDGRAWAFEEVNEVFVDVGDGDDQARSSKPKEIVVVGAKLHFDMGAGNDRVAIDNPLDESASLGRQVSIVQDMFIDLGAGADELIANVLDADILSLNVLSADGGDRVDIGHALGFRHEHTRPEARIDFDLGGGGNSVEVRMQDVEDVDLSIVAEPANPGPARGGTVNVYWHVINNSSTVSAGRMDGVVILTSSLPGGSAGCQHGSAHVSGHNQRPYAVNGRRQTRPRLRQRYGLYF